MKEMPWLNDRRRVRSEYSTEDGLLGRRAAYLPLLERFSNRAELGCLPRTHQTGVVSPGLRRNARSGGAFWSAQGAQDSQFEAVSILAQESVPSPPSAVSSSPRPSMVSSPPRPSKRSSPARLTSTLGPSSPMRVSLP